MTDVIMLKDVRRDRDRAEQKRLNARNNSYARNVGDFAERAVTLAEWTIGPTVHAWDRADALLDAAMHILSSDPQETFMEPDAVHNLRTRSEKAIKRFLEAERERRRNG